jgi:hypothetical protein
VWRPTPPLQATVFLVAGSIPAQVQTPIGFGATLALAERSAGAQVRGFACDPPSGDWYLAIGRTLYQRPANGGNSTVHQFAGGDDVAFVHYGGADRTVWFASLQTGTLWRLDCASGQLASLPGLRNTFDFAVHPGGALCATANPLWPAAGANSSVWVVGAGAPRQILPSTGPSGPLTFLADGSLVVADLPAIVPAPPGSVRLLRFSPGDVDRALYHGGMLASAQAVAVGTGGNGAFDLAADDRGGLHVSDPSSTSLPCVLAATLQPAPEQAVHGLPGFGVHLQFVPSATGPYAPYLPEQHAGSLLVASSDFVANYEVTRVHSRRPQLAIWPGTTFGAGTARLGVADAEPLGLAILCGSTTAAGEAPIPIPGAVPLWFGLAAAPAIATLATPLDSLGQANFALRHPGGFAATLHFQAIGFGAPGSGRHGSSAVVTANLLP